MKSYRLLEGAFFDLESAANWYADRDASLLAKFRTALDEAIERASKNPKLFPIVVRRRQQRKVLFAGFPYQLIFEETADEIVVVAVAHAKRKPGYWLARVK